MDYSVFKEHLQSLVESHDISYSELSRELNITPATLSRYLTSTTKTPDLNCIIKIAAYFNVSIDWLVGLNDKRYDTLQPEVQEIINCYSVASPSDRSNN